MNKKMILIFTCLWLIAFSFIIHSQNKPSIHNATINDLNDVQSIGDVLSKQIYTYVQSNDINSVNKLKNVIPNVGDKRLKELKKKYK